MGGGGSRELCDVDFGKKLCAAIQSSQRSKDFCDLTILSSINSVYRANKVILSIAFPKLEETLQDKDCLDTAIPDEVMQHLGTYAYFGRLVLDDHLLAMVSAMLELLPAEELQKKITEEVGVHVKMLLTNRKLVETLSTAEMAALVFVAKLHDLDIVELLYDWVMSRARQRDDLVDTYLNFTNYSLKSKKGDPLSFFGLLAGDLKLDSEHHEKK